MGRLLELDTPGGRLGVWAVGTEAGAPVILLQEYWGLVDQIKGVADRLAAEGFSVFVPDLYGGRVTSDPQEAAGFMQRLDPRQAAGQVAGIIDHLHTGAPAPLKGVGCVGFCMGGGLALYLAAVEPRLAACVVYYGALPWPETGFDPAAVRCPMLMHYAEHDQWATVDLARDFHERMRGAGVDATLHVYAGAAHAFVDETRPASHDPVATARSWQRTVEFLHGRLEAGVS